MTSFVSGNGIWICFAFLVLFFLAIAYGHYSRTGSGIDQHPYDATSGDAPGAEIPSTIGGDVDRRDHSRGTR